MLFSSWNLQKFASTAGRNFEINSGSGQTASPSHHDDFLGIYSRSPATCFRNRSGSRRTEHHRIYRSRRNAAASTLAILIVPVLFVIITRISYGKKELDYLQAHHEELMEREKKIEQQKIDPELEYEMTHQDGRNEESGKEH